MQNRRGDIGNLIERVQQLLAKHGDSMIIRGEICAPIAELFAMKLAEHQLLEPFVRTFNGIAERRLKDALAERAGESELRTIALSYPGTPAARAAWQWLADAAWDTGRLGLYLDYAQRAGESDSEKLAKRLQAAFVLLAPDKSLDLPSTLDGLEEMWRIDLTEAMTGSRPAPLMGDRALRRVRRNQLPVQQRYSITTSAGELSAASDGQSFFLFDHLIGRLIGDIRPLGSMPMGSLPSRPAVMRDGFVGLGWVEDHAVLVALDRLGEEKWRANSPSFGNLPALSAPIVMDNLVVFSALVIGNNEGAELRALAFRADNGRPVWNTLVTRISIPRQMLFTGSEFGLTAPAITSHGGSIMILSNNGMIARIGIDGNVTRLWTYPSVSDEFVDGFGNRPISTRQGAIISDGTWLAASPVDSPGVVLMMGPDDIAPRRYQGDGANGEVLDVAHGVALLAGTRNLALLNLKTAISPWAISFSGGRDGVHGRIGTDQVLVGTNEQLALIDFKTGRMISSRGLGQGMSLALTADLVMAATSDRVIGWGRGASFLERLSKAAAAKPNDYRPWGTLASFYDSRGEKERSFSCLIEALQRGATADYAERAARLVRAQLELNAGDKTTFAVPLAKLQSLTTYHDRLIGEVALWEGRHAELQGDTATATTLYRKASLGSDYRMLLKDRLEVSVHALAQSGLARLAGQATRPVKLVHQRPLPKANSLWKSPGKRGITTLLAGDLAVGFSDGFLNAVRVADGVESWRRKPVRQLLGVISSPNPTVDTEEGIPIAEVVLGSSAAGAGMRNGDILLTFQGRKTTNFERDLRAVVTAMAPATPFTMTVRRAGEVIELRGILGGEPVEPLAANSKTLLLWKTLPITNPQARQQAAPEGMWFSAVDIASGNELFRYALRPTDDQGVAPPQPLLTDDDYILTQEANDLICLSAHGNKPGEEPVPLWRLPLGENGMSQMRLLSDGLLWLPEDGRNRIHIVDLTTGRTLYVLPEDEAADPILVGDLCYCLGQAGRITCWDLGVGRQRWRTEKVYGRLHAVSGDGIYASDDQNQLVVLDAFSGDVRRRFGDWSTIESVMSDANYLSVFVRRTDRSQALARISLVGGHVVWEQRLPPGVEVQKLISATDAFGAILSDGPSKRTLFIVGLDGTIRTACPIGLEDKILPIAGSVLSYGVDGLQVLPNFTPQAAQPIPCLLIDDLDKKEKDLVKIYKHVRASLQWQTVGTAAYALTRLRGSLIVFTRLGPDGASVTLRLADGDSTIDAIGQMASFTPTHPQFTGGGAWVVDAAQRISSDGEPIVLGLRLQASPERLPASQLSVRAACGNDSDAPNAPWWLQRVWRPVTGGP